ncbi:inositol monophosphatase [Agrobacterium vitis]|uniref:inositol monophosphatase family protein n=1 Tax=Agrobacterium vitis TaxID=373 RepID=UPI001F30511E|nr:inositol monophosphatase family protein [Agrobacterium vitis]MCF1465540.1 inositol monophosphatase [Agrobacterium vitis]
MTDLSARDRLAPDSSPRLLALASIALEAGALARQSLRRRHVDQMVSKGPRDYQTEIDVAVERLIVAGVSEAFPDHAIQGEEETGNRIGGPDAPVIYIDPIDGTTNFAWGLPHFGMTIAIAEQGKITCGVVYDSMLDELFSAEIGKGATLNGEKLQCAEVADVQNVLVGAGLPVPGQVKSVDEELYHRALRRLMDNTAGVRRLGSAALSVAYVACGRLDGFFEDGLQVHDYGAAALILTEAGGLVTGFGGMPVDAGGGILAATPALHPWLLAGFQPAMDR